VKYQCWGKKFDYYQSDGERWSTEKDGVLAEICRAVAVSGGPFERRKQPISGGDGNTSLGMGKRPPSQGRMGQ